MLPRNNAASLALKELISKQSFYARDAFHLLEKGADPDSKNSNGSTLLHCMVKNIDINNDSSFEKLIQTYKANIHIRNRHGQTPFQCLIEGAFKTADALLLIRLGADPNSKNSNGNTLLHRMVQNININNNSSFEKLIQTYKANIHIQNRYGQTPFQCLIEGTFKTADALLLIRLGADPDSKNSSGSTLLHRMVQNIDVTNDSSFEKLIQTYKANIHIRNRQGQTPFQCLMEGSPKIADALLLLRLGADPNSKNSFGNSLLHRMVKSIDAVQNSEFEKVVKTYGADINIKNRQGQTPFQCLIEGNFKPRDAMMLVELGADPNSQNSNGKTLLQLFMKNINFVPNELIDRLIKITSSISSTPIIPDVNIQVATTPLMNPDDLSNDDKVITKPMAMQYVKIDSVYPLLPETKNSHSTQEVEIIDLLKWPENETSNSQSASASSISSLRQFSTFSVNDGKPVVSSSEVELFSVKKSKG